VFPHSAIHPMRSFMSDMDNTEPTPKPLPEPVPPDPGWELEQIHGTSAPGIVWETGGIELGSEPEWDAGE